MISCDRKEAKNESDTILLESIKYYLNAPDNSELDSSLTLKLTEKAKHLINLLPKDSIYFKNKLF